MTDSGRTLVVARCDEWRSNCTVHETVDDANRYQLADPAHDSFSQYSINVDTQYFVLVVLKRPWYPMFTFTVCRCTADENVNDVFILLVYRIMCRMVGRLRDADDVQEMRQTAGTCQDTFVELCNQRVRDAGEYEVIGAHIVDLHHGQKTKSAARPTLCSRGSVAERVS